MDDNEYYEKMRNHNLNRINIYSKKNKSSYSKWKISQGREDAEMLIEKNPQTTEEKNISSYEEINN